jgi:hypothetical protein
LLFGVAPIVWLLLLTSTIVSARRREGKLRADLNELAEQVKHLVVAEQRRFYQQLRRPLETPLAVEAEENPKSIVAMKVVSTQQT